MRLRYILAMGALLLVTALGARLSDAQFPGPIVNLLVPPAAGAPQQTIAGITPLNGSCQTGAAGVTCVAISTAMLPALPNFAADGGTYALVTSGFGCSGGDTSDFAISPTSGIISLSNASAAVQTDTVCVKAQTTAANVTNSPRYQAVSIKVTSSATAGCGAAPTGDAAADVTAAGFTTCALYNDFTTAIPNTVGTGLPGALPPSNNSGTASGNWIDCNGDTATNSIWYWQSGVGPCSYATQTTDTVSGGLALLMTVPAAALQAGGGTSSWYLTTDANCGVHNINTICNTPYPWNFPDGVYFEAKYRDDRPTSYGSRLQFWSAGGSNYAPCEPDSNYAIEVDFLEFYQSNNIGANGGYIWGSGNSGCIGQTSIGGSTFNGNNPIDMTSSYITVGNLLTHDTNGNFLRCTYFNGTRLSCGGAGVAAPAGFTEERRAIIFWMTGGCANNNSSCPDDHVYIQYVKAITCHNWQSSDPATWACSGTSNNGNFYTGAGG